MKDNAYTKTINKLRSEGKHNILEIPLEDQLKWKDQMEQLRRETIKKLKEGETEASQIIVF